MRHFLQVMMSIVSSPISAAYVIHANLCADDDTVLLTEIISTTLVMCGVGIFLQVTLGVRLVKWVAAYHMDK